MIGYVKTIGVFGRDPRFVFGNDVLPPSWTSILPESWDESKTDFKGGRGRGTKKVFSSRLPAPPPLVFSLAFQDGGRDQCTSEFPLKNDCRLIDNIHSES